MADAGCPTSAANKAKRGFLGKQRWAVWLVEGQKDPLIGRLGGRFSLVDRQPEGPLRREVFVPGLGAGSTYPQITLGA